MLGPWVGTRVNSSGWSTSWGISSRSAPARAALSGASAGRRARVERRLMELLGADLPTEERRTGVRVVTNLPVRLRIGGNASPGRVADVGAGGAFVETALSGTVGDTVEVEVERAKGLADPWVPPARARGLAVGAQGRRRGGLGIAFAATSEADERRLRRFVLDVLREHVPRSHD